MYVVVVKCVNVCMVFDLIGRFCFKVLPSVACFTATITYSLLTEWYKFLRGVLRGSSEKWWKALQYDLCAFEYNNFRKNIGDLVIGIRAYKNPVDKMKDKNRICNWRSLAIHHQPSKLKQAQQNPMMLTSSHSVLFPYGSHKWDPFVIRFSQSFKMKRFK